MKEISFWLNANKIALNVAKTEVILFKTKHKPCDTALRLKDIINPYNCLLKYAKFSVKTNNKKIRSNIIKYPIYCCFGWYIFFVCDFAIIHY